MGRARDLTMGPGRRNRPPSLETRLKAFTRAAKPDLTAFLALLKEAGSTRRPLTFREGQALGPARLRYYALTGDWPDGPDNPYRARNAPPTRQD